MTTPIPRRTGKRRPARAAAHATGAADKAGRNCVAGRQHPQKSQCKYDFQASNSFFADTDLQLTNRPFTLGLEFASRREIHKAPSELYRSHSPFAFGAVAAARFTKPLAADADTA